MGEKPLNELIPDAAKAHIMEKLSDLFTAGTNRPFNFPNHKAAVKSEMFTDLLKKQV